MMTEAEWDAYWASLSDEQRRAEMRAMAEYSAESDY
jgi:hypothetical protein